ncbi:helix-turn-helix domain-containing protein [Ktedonospora formicarum]|uniref:HTH cro/C1-type domain-containing protein n=1 Tax=Ktedonospora formicarum TaxID=2778364 RepID=A0A8J3I480_9CHLR|nr:helix-turn-helix transcriptional regulator [Ktedonospora formicarum]GHO44544.1 hypothetical protein KSX_27070 [Ktedonospora formicarum]
MERAYVQPPESGDWLRDRRIKLYGSQQNLVASVNGFLNTMDLSRLENAQKRPRIGTVAIVAYALRVTPEEMFQQLKLPVRTLQHKHEQLEKLSDRELREKRDRGLELWRQFTVEAGEPRDELDPFYRLEHRTFSNFGAALKKRREELGWNQPELARQSGHIGKNLISRIERGDITEPTVYTAAHLAYACDRAMSFSFKVLGYPVYVSPHQKELVQEILNIYFMLPLMEEYEFI